MSHNPHLTYQLARTRADGLHREAPGAAATTRRRARRWGLR
jgi:hypothetical protein